MPVVKLFFRLKVTIVKLFTKCKGSDGLMDKMSASQHWDCGFEPHTGHDHDSSYDTSTG